MIQRPADMNAFEFVVLAALRVTQLTRGSVPRVDGTHKVTVIAQREIAAGKIVRETTGVAVEALQGAEA